MGITAVGVGATALAAVASTAGAISSSQAQARQARYQAQVAANNATIANQNATLAGQQADAKAQADYRAGAIKMGAQRAALAANGGTLDSGSGAAVQSTTAENTALGVDNALYEGSLQSFGLRAQAGNFTAQSGLDEATASNAETAGALSSVSSLASGASQFASKWQQYYGTPTNTPQTGVGVQAGVGGVY